MKKQEKEENDKIAQKRLDEKLKKEEEDRIRIFEKIMSEKQGVKAEEVEYFIDIYGDLSGYINSKE